MAGEKRAVLLVEHDAATQALYERELHSYYHILTAHHVDEVLRLLETMEIAAVVLEPAGFDDAGWNLITAIHESPNHPAIQVILCSVLDERKRGRNLGVAAYLVKPVLPTTLRETLDHVLQG